jgi:peptidylprolyl isomerase
MANGGPGTNAATFCVTLGDRSYLDGDYIVWGEIVEGMDVVMAVEQGDVIDSVRIERVGAAAEAFRPDNESFRRLLAEAEERAAEHATLKRTAFHDWIQQNWPEATGPEGGVLTQVLAAGSGSPGSGPKQVRYQGTQIRYMGHVIGREEPPLEVTTFGSGPDGVPGVIDPPQEFTFTPGETELNPGLDAAIAEMAPGERRAVVVPAEHGYGRGGLYPPETPGQRRFVISPEVLLVYEGEVVG